MQSEVIKNQKPKHRTVPSGEIWCVKNDSLPSLGVSVYFPHSTFFSPPEGEIKKFNFSEILELLLDDSALHGAIVVLIENLAKKAFR